MMQAQRSAKKTVSAMTVLVSRNDDDEDEESRTGMVSSTAISGILLMNLAFTIWGFGEIQPWTKTQATLKETELEVRKILSNGYK